MSGFVIQNIALKVQSAFERIAFATTVVFGPIKWIYPRQITRSKWQDFFLI